MTDPILRMEGITKTFPGVKALDNVTFEVYPGEVHVLLGENGAGKSTLVKILAGVHHPDSGTVYVDGKVTRILTTSMAHRLGISTIYQELTLAPNLTVAENIFLGRELTQKRMPIVLDQMAMRKAADEVLNGVLRAGIDVTSMTGSLGVAQQQLVEIARALFGQARIIIMDEPTSALVKIDILFDTIRTLKQRGVSVIYISHRLEEIAVIGDRITVLRDGTYVGTVPARSTDIGTLVRMIVGRRLEEKYPKQSAATGRIRLSVRGLNKKGVLKDICLDAKGGEILGIAGLVGSGRTELAKAIFGAEPPDSGSIKVDGAQVLVRSPKEAIEHGIGLIPEDRKIDGLIDILSVRENLTLPIIQRIKRLFLIDRGRQSELSHEYVQQLQIKTPSINRAVRYLSGGNQQKVVVAKWMLTESKVLIFDEPTRGIDVGAKVEIYRLMNALAARGTSIIMISSEMPEVLGMSDRILVMRQGAIAGEFSRDEADQERIMRCALSA